METHASRHLRNIFDNLNEEVLFQLRLVRRETSKASPGALARGRRRFGRWAWAAFLTPYWRTTCGCSTVQLSGKLEAPPTWDIYRLHYTKTIGVLGMYVVVRV